MPPSGTSDYTRATRDTSIKASGDSSLRFTIPSNSGSDSSGTYFTNFSKDLSVQFDAGQEFFVQWRQRFSPEFITTQYTGGGGFKQIIVGTGDQPGTIFSSCSSLELPLFNYGQNGFPVMYNSCAGSASHGPFDGFYEPFGAYDFKLQNGRPSPGCLYSQKSGYFAPTGNCFGYVANEWMTFQMHVKIGTWYKNDSRYHGDSTIRLWVARERQPSKLVVNLSPEPAILFGMQIPGSGTGYDLANSNPDARYGKLWLLPYNTNKDSSASHPTAYTWYDELIVSTKRIPDPN